MTYVPTPFGLASLGSGRGTRQTFPPSGCEETPRLPQEVGGPRSDYMQGHNSRYVGRSGPGFSTIRRDEES